MPDQYQLHPSTVKLLAKELSRAVDDYNMKKLDLDQLSSLVVHWASTSGKKLFSAPDRFNPTITQRVGTRRLEIVRHIFKGSRSARNPLTEGGLIITVGLPCSGKSTLVKKCANYAPRIAIVCPDTIRLVLHGKQFKKEAEPAVWAAAQTMVKTLLNDGFTVIVDATNVTVQARKTWSQIAKEMGLRLNIFLFDVSAPTCKERNKQIRRLEESVIDRMEKQFEQPTFIEGSIFTAKEISQLLD